MCDSGPSYLQLFTILNYELSLLSRFATNFNIQNSKLSIQN
jgi:hypothetical protein